MSKVLANQGNKSDCKTVQGRVPVVAGRVWLQGVPAEVQFGQPQVHQQLPRLLGEEAPGAWGWLQLKHLGPHLGLGMVNWINSSSGIQVSRSPGLQVYRSPGIQVYRSTGLQVYTTTCLQVHGQTGLQAYRYTCTQVYMATDLQVSSSIFLQLNRYTSLQLSFNCYRGKVATSNAGHHRLQGYRVSVACRHSGLLDYLQPIPS